MRKRRLGHSDLHLSVIGLGTWAIGGDGWKAAWGPQDDEASIATIHEALDRGVDWIDTAAVYGIGHSEEVIGAALRGRSGPIPLIATKCGRRATATGIEGALDAVSIAEECDASLARLGVETIDLWQLHWPKPDEMIEEAWAAMADQVAAGKVRHLGVSNCDVAQMQRLQAIHPITSLQPPYSLLRRDIEQDLLPWCREQGIGLLCYSPMGKGLLSGRMSAERAAMLPPGDHRRRDLDFQEPRLSAHLRLVEGLRSLATAAGYAPAHLAIAWCLRDPGVTAAIVGARQPGQITETVRAGDWVLDEATVAAVEELLREHRGAIDAITV